MSASSDSEIWVEMVGKIIVARIHGAATPDILHERHTRICRLKADTGCTGLLLNDLEMTPMEYESLVVQQGLCVELDRMSFRVAVLVPNSRLAYLARLQFSKPHHRIFYNDLEAAVLWLSKTHDDATVRD